jgi:hypothetical protein
MTKKLQERLAKLAGGVAAMLSAASEVEMKEKKTELMMLCTQHLQL